MVHARAAAAATAATDPRPEPPRARGGRRDAQPASRRSTTSEISSERLITAEEFAWVAHVPVRAHRDRTEGRQGVHGDGPPGPAAAAPRAEHVRRVLRTARRPTTRSRPNWPIDLLTTNETYFFREPSHFEFLGQTGRRTTPPGRAPVRVWSAACSSGEEAYTIAMVLADAPAAGAGLGGGRHRHLHPGASRRRGAGCTRSRPRRRSRGVLRELLPAGPRRVRGLPGDRPRAARPGHLPGGQPDRPAGRPRPRSTSSSCATS